jgi:hypothetical protein
LLHLWAFDVLQGIKISALLKFKEQWQVCFCVMHLHLRIDIVMMISCVIAT